jgi:molybdopterin molybdotransferase
MPTQEPQFSYEEALAATIAAIEPLPAETVALSGLVGRTTAKDIYALVDSPSTDVSLKDGYAVRSADVATASPEAPATLTLIGEPIVAGDSPLSPVGPGESMRILSGAPLPECADTVLAEEFATAQRDHIVVLADAKPDQNVLLKGTDVSKGQRLVSAGTALRPAQVGLLAAAGHHEATVVKPPRVAIIATGTEVVAPGHSLTAGKVFASNLVTLAAWCHHYGMVSSTRVVADDWATIQAALLDALAEHEAIVTSGGAWTGERDLVAKLLDSAGWRMVYHRVRIGPGKAVGFGIWQGKPIFILPGGPPSNQMAFLQLALPGLHRLSGYARLGLPTRRAKLASTVNGQQDWTQFLEGRFEETPGEIQFRPQKHRSRLQSMADCEGYLTIPEGVSFLEAGREVSVQILPFVRFLHN